MSSPIPLVIHATHEAGTKVGGIGSVLEGLLGAKEYNEQVARTVLVGPMFGWDALQMERLTDAGNGVQIRYSSLHGVFYGVNEEVQRTLRTVEETYQVGILYGVRRFGAVEHEILLVDASNPAIEQVSSFHFYLWEHYGIDSRRYEHDYEYGLYVSIAQPIFEGLKALEVDAGLSPSERVIIAHEWLGMPVVFAAQMSEPEQWRTVFYAHEMATARLLVEGHSGHDTRFYNVMLRARESHLPLETLFGDQSAHFKHALVRRAVHCDAVFAVGDLVREELRFLGGPFTNCRIDLVYNGIDAKVNTAEERRKSRRRLREYCERLLGFKPDYVFTHVARLVLSKALWRDTRVMMHLEQLLGSAGKKAVLFVLATSQPAGRPGELVRRWEARYGWPVGHRADNGDLTGEEAPFFFSSVEPFNHSARNSRIVLVNQFGWSRERCGERMPTSMEFQDIRRGSDVEFGQSIYEPFGIAQVEPVNFGAIACVSNVCGCIGFLEQGARGLVREGLLAGGTVDGQPLRTDAAAGLPGVEGEPTFINDRGFPLVVADYIGLPEDEAPSSAQEALVIDQAVRDRIEIRNAGATARQIFERLPSVRGRVAERIRIGNALAASMSWEIVASNYFLPALRRVCL
ncbi:MAG: hypothetical protein OXL39_01760 [Caldilineaceae bacterium]|nr:hypothetical protein [Caldilineaceae bacterium]